MSQKGQKPKNQDSYLEKQLKDFSIFAVFDGHGEYGEIISNEAKDILKGNF